ncbi:hypothetical protein SteCoe_8276 [Stentor coeruleus]|uniref:Uncharacterized protein n=1 Tax=Stentor coeruleus TaxID=5963 RepID=A0A1R2CKQ3_9CILI|nr:hypothetical protein SteCoe_8276 [Stentor coeruleus]
MGNCQKEKISAVGIQDKIFSAIKSGVYRRFTSIVDFAKLTIGIEALDNLRMKHKRITTNPIGLCLLLGCTDMFKYFLNCGCNTLEMEKCFSITQFNSIEYICRQGFHEILKVYLPIALTANVFSNKTSTNSYSMILSGSYNIKSEMLPIHLACHNGHSEIISFLFNYFKNYDNIPREYDIESLEENTGENCALIACREGHFDIVKYLYTVCNANFHIINNFNENAIIVTIAGMNKNPHYKFVDILQYLVEDIKVDVKYMYEEAIVLAKSRPIYNYLSGKLKKIGIIAERKNFDDISYEYRKKGDDEFEEPPERLFSESFIQESKYDDMRSALSSIHESVNSNDFKDSQIF